MLATWESSLGPQSDHLQAAGMLGEGEALSLQTCTFDGLHVDNLVYRPSCDRKTALHSQLKDHFHSVGNRLLP